MRCSRRAKPDRSRVDATVSDFLACASFANVVHPLDSSSSILPRNDRWAINRIPRGKKRGRGRRHRAARKKFAARRDKSRREIAAPSMAHGMWQFLPYKADFTSTLAGTSVCDRRNGNWKILPVCDSSRKCRRRMRKHPPSLSPLSRRKCSHADPKVVSNDNDSNAWKNRVLNRF